MGSYLTAGRDIYIVFLQQAAVMAGLDFNEAIGLFQNGMQLIPRIAEAILSGDLTKASSEFEQIARLEKYAFNSLLAQIEPN